MRWLVAAMLCVSSALSAQECGPLGSSYMRTTLYFGLNRKGGTISRTQWKTFVRDEVTSRFPQGLTVWEAGGQWRRADGTIVRERSKVLLLVHGDDPTVRGAVATIIGRYKQMFAQESAGCGRRRGSAPPSSGRSRRA